jgi:hypothetical protein
MEQLHGMRPPPRNTGLQVRIAQLRQLPATPRKRITMTAVREQQVESLFFRLSALRNRTSEVAAAAKGMKR